jgi:hypothetical protein
MQALAVGAAFAIASSSTIARPPAIAQAERPCRSTAIDVRDASRLIVLIPGEPPFGRHRDHFQMSEPNRTREGIG